MDCSTPGFPVYEWLLELTQLMSIESVMPSPHPLSSPSPPAFNLSQHQGIFQWVSSCHQVATVLEFQLQHQSFQWICRGTCVCVLSRFCRVWLCATLWTVAARLLCPWDSPGKNTGVDFHDLLEPWVSCIAGDSLPSEPRNRGRSWINRGGLLIERKRDGRESKQLYLLYLCVIRIRHQVGIISIWQPLNS